LLDTRGEHLRYVPGEVARAMVAAEHATVANAHGRVKSIRLVEWVATSATRVGEPIKPTGPTERALREA
jgi:hypothetical protein